MRAKSTLAVMFAMLGAVAVAPQADAAERNARSTQKQFRPPVAAPAQPATPPARAVANRSAAAKPAQPATRTAAVVPARPAPPRNQGRAVAAAPRPAELPRVVTGRAAPPPRATGQVSGPTMVAMPMIARPALGAGTGTPILPVAQSFGLSCVPFARLATGMDISGNGGQWWYNAAGRFARGQQPERGAILSFPGSGGMRSGHVAVVSRVVNSRTIEVDHANWGGPGLRRGQVLRGAVVIDVSDRNDWTAVRHQVGFDRDTFGRTYPTHGFIYNRPAGTRTLVAEAGRFEEVAEATSPHASQHMRLTSQMMAR
jgi:hypothetical protein